MQAIIWSIREKMEEQRAKAADSRRVAAFETDRAAKYDQSADEHEKALAALEEKFGFAGWRSE